jgi:N-acetylglucosaminyldiphosphoundecaprenol N-acetyl-beta-D-mannosaminyltransferase
MSQWLDDDELASRTPAPIAAQGANATEVWLRLADRCIAGSLLLLLGLPLLLLAGRLHRQPMQGRGGARLDRLSLAVPAGSLWAPARVLGMRHWPVLIHIWRGEMAFVGPRLRQLNEDPAPAVVAALRPGLVNPWFLRQRAAVDFGGEDQADLHYLRRRGLRHDLGLLLRAAALALLPAPKQAGHADRVRLVDVDFDNLSMSGALDRIEAMLDGDAARQVCFVNPACVNIASRHRGYRRLLRRADLVLPDGIGIKLGTALIGQPLRQNVNGTDLFPRLADRLQGHGTKLFLLGGGPGVAQGVAARIGERWPGLQVVGCRDGYFGVAEEGAVVAQIRASGAELLLVARGVPAQELFVHRYLPLLGVRVAMGVGGLFDFLCGRISRAPMWMRESGLEWVWRLMQEPGRMWRRYLIGNMSFVGRVLLQRLGLRKAQQEPELGVRPPPLAADVRVLLFAHQRAPEGLPVEPDMPAALLPLGCNTVIETLLGRLADAGVREVELVCCEQPEALRALVGDGGRWGLRLRWHLLKDPRYPYAPLDDRSARRLLIGHVGSVPSRSCLQSLLQSDEVLLEPVADAGLYWSGWASMSRRPQSSGVAALDREALAALLLKSGLPARPAGADQLHVLGDGVALLRAQAARCAVAHAEAPASWLRHPWGAASPLAHIAEGAMISGPALIGPGCVVERGARIGAHVVLSRDAVVSAGTRLSDCLVMPGSYLGRELELVQTVVSGSRISHLRLGVQTRLAESDALMLSLAPRRPSGPGILSRLLAAAALLLLGPALLLHGLHRRVRRQSLAWRRCLIVVGRDAQTQKLRMQSLRVPRPSATAGDRRWASLAGLLDVVAGRRHWLGSRPRTPGQWYALRPEWQSRLAGTPVGCWHAPAWYDHRALREEALAVADLYLAVLPPSQWWWLLLQAWCGRSDAALSAQGACQPAARP